MLSVCDELVTVPNNQGDETDRLAPIDALSKSNRRIITGFPLALPLMVCSHWLGPEPGPGQRPGRASINQWKHFQDLKNGYHTQFFRS